MSSNNPTFLKDLVSIAERYKVDSISLGTNPEEGEEVYYFRTPQFNPNLSDRLVKLEKELFRKGIRTYLWQAPIKDNSNHLGKTIYQIT